MAHSIHFLSAVSIAALAALGAGCSRSNDSSSLDGSRAGSDPAVGGEASHAPLRAGREDPLGSCELQSVHYAFDSSDLDDTARQRLHANARCMQRGGASTAVVTGMTDPHGTEEYNLALGDRRARAAAQYMGALGVEAHRLKPRSVGEEMSVGEDESGWADDRRAQFEAE